MFIPHGVHISDQWSTVKGIKKNTRNRKSHLSISSPMHLQMQPPNQARDSPELGGKMPTELGRGNEEPGRDHGVPKPGRQAVDIP